MGGWITKAFLRTYALKADIDGDNEVSEEEARHYFGQSFAAKMAITVLKLFGLIQSKKEKALLFYW